MASELGCISDSCNGGTGGIDVSVPFWGGDATSSYKILFLLHMVAIIVTFGPTLIWPAITRLARKHEGVEGSRIASLTYFSNKRLFVPGLIVSALLGVALVADSDKKYSMQNGWVNGAFVLVIALGCVSWFVLRPAQKRLMDGLAAGESGRDVVRTARAGIGAGQGIIHLGMVVLIILMVWKPGA